MHIPLIRFSQILIHWIVNAGIYPIHFEKYNRLLSVFKRESDFEINEYKLKEIAYLLEIHNNRIKTYPGEVKSVFSRPHFYARLR